MARLDDYEVAYRAHFLSVISNEVRADHQDHDFEDCPGWPNRWHFRLGDQLLCGAPIDGAAWTEDAFAVTCPKCLDVARAESVDQPGPHPFVHPEHCAECHAADPYRDWRRRDVRSWSGRW